MIDRSQVMNGMTVRSADGEKLGKVLACEHETFTIEKGFFFPKDYIVRFDEISDISGDEIRLRMTKDAFTEREADEDTSRSGWTSDEHLSGTTTGTGYVAGSSGSMMGRRDDALEGRGDVSMPVSEEELDVVKRDREAGEVRLRKDVVTEHKQIDVPVTREEVRVERVPASERQEALPGDRAFEERTVSVPLHEEEIEVRKRPVVKEQVRLRKERVTEQRAAGADLRKERVEVEGDARTNDLRTGKSNIDEPPGTGRAIGDRASDIEPGTGGTLRDDTDLP